MATCKVEDCLATPTRKGYCDRHYRPARRRGEVGWDGTPCEVEGCSRPVVARGRCNTHYQQLHKQESPKCSIEGCTRHSHARGWCHTHYMRFVRWGDPLAWKKPERKRCKIEDCHKFVVAYGLCQMHNARLKRTGTTDLPPKPVAVAPKLFECRHCGVTLPKGKKGFCSVEHRNAWEYWKRRKTARGVALRRRYGLTEEAFDELLTVQNRQCAICKTDVPGGTRKVFQVDHCHSSGKIRGLLCYKCNVGLSNFRDNPEFLRGAATYLER